MSKLNDKTAIVTGSGQGIGKGVALALAKEGAYVVLADLNEETAKEVQGEIESFGGKALAVKCNVRNKEDVDNVVKKAAEKNGTVHILVNNAQNFQDLFGVEEFTEELIQESFDIGFYGTFRFMQACFPYLKKQGGKVINFGSYSGINSFAKYLSYNVTKESIRALSRTAAREWGQHGINVNIICPFADSPSYYNPPNPEEAVPMMDALIESLPIPRIGKTEDDVGRVAVFLSSDDSDYMTGYTFNVDGGMAIDTAR